MTFGGLSVHAESGPLAGALAQPRRLAVLAVVARAAARGVSRSRLLAMLWPDASDEQGRRVLSQALYALRRELRSDEAIVGTQELRLNPAHVSCDVAEFDDALDRGDADTAAALYVAPFLDGFRLSSSPEFERWADDERTAIQHRFHEAAEQLARAAEIDGAFDVAVKWWRRRAADDPLNARVAVSMMRALAAAGDRNGALREARLFEALIAQELEIAPDRAVVELAEALRDEAKPDARPCIAVLPFSVIGRSDDQHWPEGLAEEIMHALAAVREVRVAARTGAVVSGSTHVLEGSLRFSATEVRATVRLVDVVNGHAVWSERFSSAPGDTHIVQEAIAKQITASIARRNASPQ